MTDKQKAVCAEMAKLSGELEGVARKMLDLYVKNDWLNDEQPDSFSGVIPASLDEWCDALNCNQEDWEAISK